jgi:hypothetical protein
VTDKDGQDITSTAGANYQIIYSADASNQSNYQSATYQSTASNATMIKLVNTS